MTILVLGGSGFMGRRVVSRLVAEGEKVVATARQVDSRGDEPNLAWRAVDLESFDAWDELLADVSTVYHLAWSSIPSTAAADPTADTRTNVVGTVGLLHALSRRPRVRIVFASSGGTVYGPLRDNVPAAEDHVTEPTGAYGIGKLAVERYINHFAENHGVPAVILRFGNPFGEGQNSRREFGAVSTFCSLALERKPITIFGNGSIVRDYFHVDDGVEALLLAKETQSSHRVFNIGSGRGRSLNDIVHSIEGVLKRRVPVQYQPGRTFDIPVSVLDVSRAKAALGWAQKISFEQGIARMLGVAHVENEEP